VFHGRQVDTTNIAIDADHGWQACGEVEIRRPLFNAESQQFCYVHSESLCGGSLVLLCRGANQEQRRPTVEPSICRILPATSTTLYMRSPRWRKTMAEMATTSS